jgi:hypothetical protein
MVFYDKIKYNACGFTIHSFYSVGSHKFTVFVIQQLAVYKISLRFLIRCIVVVLKYLKKK